jgi:hypothetical protein
MKKLLTLLFCLALAFYLTMPVFAQDSAGGQDAPKADKKAKKAKKEKKAKKAKAPAGDATK